MPTQPATPLARAHHTARGATTMTRWAMRFASRGKKRWQFVAFAGPAGAESRAVVDLLAICRDHSLAGERHGLKRGDLLSSCSFQSK